MGLAAVLRGIDADLEAALAEVGLPCYLVDRDGRFRWLNRAAHDLLGVDVGIRFTRVVAPEDVHSARALFARKLLGGEGATEFTLRVIDTEGRRVTVDIHSVPVLDDGAVVGVFGLGRTISTAESVCEAPALTPRQHEILHLLAEGASTADIAGRLGLAAETVRNHVRGLLRALGAHSRLEAVAIGGRLGLLG